ncbi:peptidoglycan-binding protein [Aquabacterium sp.]|uniref:peptidoglycan-binding domain-containing protein n=1 Tax=Aquabacterium sp. TaxID=1872578 RepID=UPI003782E730
MAGSSKPGPLAAHHDPAASLNDGTMARLRMPAPGITHQGSVAAWPASAGPPRVFRTPARRPSLARAYPRLAEGSSGSAVVLLQRRINLLAAPAPLLVLDGLFGPLTRRAVQDFQRTHQLAADGVVGPKTWFHLCRDEASAAAQAAWQAAALVAATQAVATRTAASTPESLLLAALPPAAETVADWPLERKFAEALRRTAPKLPSHLQHEFLALLSPKSLGIMAGTLVVWAGSHAFGVGEAVDILLLIGGIAMLGMAAFDVAGEIGSFLSLAAGATTPAELDEAAGHLARAIAVIGVAAFIALLVRVARGRIGRGKPPPEAPPEPPASKSRPTRPVEPLEPVEPPPRPKPPPEEPAPKDLPPLRQAYVDEVARLRSKGQAMLDAGQSPEEVARALHAERRAIGEKYKSLTPPEKLAEIYQRNLDRYGDKLGPTVDWLREQGKTWEQIIESAGRAGGKDLGF